MLKVTFFMAFEASFFFEPGCEGDTWVSFDDKRMKRLSPSARLRCDKLREAEHHKLPPDAMGPIDLRLQWLAALTGPAPDNFDSVIKADRHLNSPCLRLRAWICGVGNRQNLLVPNRGVLSNLRSACGLNENYRSTGLTCCSSQAVSCSRVTNPAARSSINRSCSSIVP